MTGASAFTGTGGGAMDAGAMADAAEAVDFDRFTPSADALEIDRIAPLSA